MKLFQNRKIVHTKSTYDQYRENINAGIVTLIIRKPETIKKSFLPKKPSLIKLKYVIEQKKLVMTKLA